ncbi:MAG: transglutaminase-like domain-containing protein [Candidatus Enteromonas sp.]|nr:transglutaminase-like domain-containing protein [Candidatus Enteromonas sp.]
MRETKILVEAIRNRKTEVEIHSFLSRSMLLSAVNEALLICNLGSEIFQGITREDLISPFVVHFTYSSLSPQPGNPRRHVHLRAPEEESPVVTLSEKEVRVVGYSLYEPISKLISQIKIDTTSVFFIPCNSMMAMGDKIGKHLPSLLSASEGVSGAKYWSGTHEAKNGIFLEFPLSMPIPQFVDHREKGIEKAKTLMKTLTHGASFPPEVYCLLVCGFLQTRVSYDGEDALSPKADNHMAYGPLVRKKGVCEGYSWAAIHMLEAVGIPAKMVIGKKDKVNHSWVKVTINGKDFHMEVTSSQTVPGSIALLNFLVSDAKLRQNGYSFEGNSCSTTWYENFSFLSQAFLSKKETYISRGASPEIFRQEFIPGKAI